MPHYPDLADKVVLVTGAGSGIGVGIRGACRDSDSPLLGRGHRSQPRQLRRLRCGVSQPMPSASTTCLAMWRSGHVLSTKITMTGTKKSARIELLTIRCAAVRGSTNRGSCVPPGGTTACRITGTAPSDFVVPGTNPFPSFLFPFSKDPCVGKGGVSPPDFPMPKMRTTPVESVETCHKLLLWWTQ